MQITLGNDNGALLVINNCILSYRSDFENDTFLNRRVIIKNNKEIKSKGNKTISRKRRLVLKGVTNGEEVRDFILNDLQFANNKMTISSDNPDLDLGAGKGNAITAYNNCYLLNNDTGFIERIVGNSYRIILEYIVGKI